MENRKQAAVWEKHAKQWGAVGAPLKPSPEDGSFALTALLPLFKQGGHQVAILGVTPELVQLPWPQTVGIRAFDHSAEMIASIWSPHPVNSSTVTRSRWQSLPVTAASFDAAVGDGCLNALPDLSEFAAVLRELHRVLKPAARAAVRCFVRPDMPEQLSEIVADVNAGRIRGFHALKWRVAMSLANVSGSAVTVSAIHRAFDTAFPSRAELSAKTGWQESAIDTIDAYKDAPTRYTFPTFAELERECRPYFEVVDVGYGSYELADRCPTIVLQRLQSTKGGK